MTTKLRRDFRVAQVFAEDLEAFRKTAGPGGIKATRAKLYRQAAAALAAKVTDTPYEELRATLLPEIDRDLALVAQSSIWRKPTAGVQLSHIPQDSAAIDRALVVLGLPAGNGYAAFMRCAMMRHARSAGTTLRTKPGDLADEIVKPRGVRDEED